MQLYYAKSTNGFYAPEVNGVALPVDAVEITEEQHRALLQAQSTGKVIQAGADGMPVALDPPSPTFDAIKAAKLALLNAQAQAVADKFTAGYPAFEMDTWADQQSEALAWEKDSSAATPCIDALASYRGIDRTLYLQKTLAKVKAFRAAGLFLAGTRQRYEDAIKAAPDAAALDAIVFDFTLPA